MRKLLFVVSCLTLFAVDCTGRSNQNLEPKEKNFLEEIMGQTYVGEKNAMGSGWTKRFLVIREGAILFPLERHRGSSTYVTMQPPKRSGKNFIAGVGTSEMIDMGKNKFYLLYTVDYKVLENEKDYFVIRATTPVDGAALLGTLQTEKVKVERDGVDAVTLTEYQGAITIVNGLSNMSFPAGTKTVKLKKVPSSDFQY